MRPRSVRSAGPQAADLECWWAGTADEVVGRWKIGLPRLVPPYDLVLRVVERRKFFSVASTAFSVCRRHCSNRSTSLPPTESLSAG